MTELAGWLDRQSRYDGRAVILEDALLGGRFRDYAFYRLRYFMLRYAASSITHVIRLVFLYYTLPTGAFLAIVMLHAVSHLVSSFWWGGLEVMRERVREIYRSGRPDLVPHEVGRWLSLSIQITSATLVLAAAWMVWKFGYHADRFQAVDLYVVSIAVNLGLTFTTRCYHSGVYAIRRIYRPALAIVALELLSFGLVPGLWWWVGAWSVPIASLTSALLAAGMTVYYTRRLYRFFAFSPERFLSLTKLELPFLDSLGSFLGGGWAYAVMQLESLLLVALVVGGSGGGSEPALATLLFAMGPAVRADLGWAQLFYFDLKRLEARLFRNVRDRFTTSTYRLAALLAPLFWLAAMMVGTLVLQRSLGWLYWLMLPFFFSHAFLALAQVAAFSAKAYGRVITSGLIVFLGYLGLQRVFPDPAEQTLVLSALALVAFSLLRAQEGSLGDRPGPDGHTSWPLQWVAQIRAVQEPVEVSAAQFFIPREMLPPARLQEWAHQNRAKYRQLAGAIDSELGRWGAVTLVDAGRVVWYERVDGERKIGDEWLLREAAGLVSWVRHAGVFSDGPTALEAASEGGLVSDSLFPADPAGRFRDQEAIKAEFGRMVPGGIVYDPGEPVSEALAGIPDRERREIRILHEAALFAEGRTGRSASPYEVTALIEDDELRLVFLSHRRLDRRLREGWRELITRRNLMGVFRSVPPASGQPHRNKRVLFGDHRGKKGALTLGRAIAPLAAAMMLLGTLYVIQPTLAREASDHIAVHGYVVSEEGSRPAWVVFETATGTIVDVCESESEVPAGAEIISYDGYIFPGLIDTHNHPRWNSIPLWRSGRTYENRYEWQGSPDYQSQVSSAFDGLMNSGLAFESLTYAEVRGLVGGTTMMQGSDDADGYLVRNLDDVPWGVASYTSDVTVAPLEFFEEAKRDLGTGTVKRLFLHVGEGRGDDVRSKAEFEHLKAVGLTRPGVVIIHGIALTADDFKTMARNGMYLVWSPKSNDVLYGETADIMAAREAGVTVALGPDWSITGSDNLLEELRVAYDYSQRELGGVLTPRQLFGMVTTDAATVAGVDGPEGERLGRIAVGYEADLFLAPVLDIDPYLSLLKTYPEDIELVVIDGQVVCGDPTLMDALGHGEDSDRVVVNGDQKLVHVAVGRGYPDFGALTQALDQVLVVRAPLVEDEAVPATGAFPAPNSGPSIE